MVKGAWGSASPAKQAPSCLAEYSIWHSASKNPIAPHIGGGPGRNPEDTQIIDDSMKELLVS